MLIAFGTLNKRQAFHVDFNKTLDWEHPSEDLSDSKAPRLTKEWLNSFEEFHEYKIGAINIQNADDDYDAFDKIMYSFFGKTFDSDLNWDELGMVSMMSIEVRDAINDRFHIALDPNCFDTYPTPIMLKNFVLGNE
eukprot:10325937-Ditylum_brightwellii.AAC.1